MLTAIFTEGARDQVLRNGGAVVASYAEGWIVEVWAEPVGEVSYRLRDGSILRAHEGPRTITYPESGIFPGRDARFEWGEPQVEGDTWWLGYGSAGSVPPSWPSQAAFGAAGRSTGRARSGAAAIEREVRPARDGAPRRWSWLRRLLRGSRSAGESAH